MCERLKHLILLLLIKIEQFHKAAKVMVCLLLHPGRSLGQILCRERCLDCGDCTFRRLNAC